MRRLFSMCHRYVQSPDQELSAREIHREHKLFYVLENFTLCLWLVHEQIQKGARCTRKWGVVNYLLVSRIISLAMELSAAPIGITCHNLSTTRYWSGAQPLSQNETEHTHPKIKINEKPIQTSDQKSICIWYPSISHWSLSLCYRLSGSLTQMGSGLTIPAASDLL